MKMNRLLILVSAFFFGFQAYSQTFNWASIAAGPDGEDGKTIQVDSQGNVIVAGYFQGTVDFDPGVGVSQLTSNGAEDIFLQKLNANGDLIWVKQFGGLASETSFSLALTANDEIVLSGYFAGAMDADPGPNVVTITPVGSTNSFIVKLDDSGNYIWSKQFGGGSPNAICSITTVGVDPSGNICAFGMFSGTVDFNPGPATQFGASLMFSDLFFLKLNSSGDFVWVRFINGNSFDFATKMVVDDNGSFIATGRFQGTADFNPGLANNSFSSTFSSFDSYVVKIDTNGDYVWAKTFGGAGQCYSNDVEIDPLGNIYTAGSFNGTVDFDPRASNFSLTSNGNFDMFLQKLDGNGNFVSAIQIGSTGDDSGSSIESDNAGNIYVSGTFSNTVDFDPGAGVSNFTSVGSNGYLLKLNANGTFSWLYHISGGPSLIYASAIAPNNGVYCIGNFQNSVNFNPFGTPINENSSGSLDAFVIGLSQTSCSTTFGTDVQNSCTSYTWIDGNTYSTSNNMAQFTLTNAGGCDSIVTLDLTIWNCITLTNAFCGITNVTMNQLVNAQNVGALQYRFRITGNNSQAWPNNEFVYTSNSRNFRFQFIPGAMWGETYSVEVAYSMVPGVFSPYGSPCTVSLQPLAVQPLSVVDPADCGTTLTMDEWVNTAFVSGALAYRFQIVGINGNGWPSNTYEAITSSPIRKFRFFDIPGALFGETYAVSVAYQDGSGNWTAYGAPCNITIVTPATHLQSGDCGITGLMGGQNILAENIIGASSYRFRITGPNNMSWANNQITVDRPNRVFWMNLANGWLPGETYTVEVAVQDAAGYYGAYGAACSVTMSGTPLLTISNIDAAVNMKASIETTFGATASHNPFTRDFGLQLLNANDSEAINLAIYDMTGKLIETSSVNPTDIESVRFGANLATGMYMIQVTQGANQAVIRQLKN
jgi:hypothetical protein